VAVKIFPRLGVEYRNPRWWFEVLIIAISYYIVSWLVLRKMSVPAFGTPVWPGTGFAVGGLLLWGRSRWFGVFLGAMLASSIGLKNIIFNILAIKSASNGQEAVRIWDEWEPHLIFMDMRMPIMDGYDATKQIKFTTKGNATAIIALTASVLEEEKAIVISAGCDDFLRKPFAEQTIFDALAKHLGVKYIFADDHPVNYENSSENGLTSDNFKCMPQVWINQLYEAALEADTNSVLQLVTEIPETEKYLIKSLNKMARHFEFEQLVDLIEPLINNHE
jgi:CheY-like chemotaxis protein